MRLQSEDNTVWVDDLGATITRWQWKDIDIFFPQQYVEVDGKLKLRGGMHICFPQFDSAPKEGPLSALGPDKHGFGRDISFNLKSRWRTSQAQYGTGTLGGREDFPWRFNIVVEIIVLPYGFEYIMFIENHSGHDADPMPICPALHPYFAIERNPCIRQNKSVWMMSLPVRQSQRHEMAGDKTFTLEHPSGLVLVQTDCEDSSLECTHIAFWSDRGGYFCAEPIWGDHKKFGTPDGTYLPSGEKAVITCAFGFDPS